VSSAAVKPDVAATSGMMLPAPVDALPGPAGGAVRAVDICHSRLHWEQYSQDCMLLIARQAGKYLPT